MCERERRRVCVSVSVLCESAVCVLCESASVRV